MWNVGYTTPSSAFAEANGITYGSGYYFLGPGQMGGIVLDVDIMNYFGQSAPNYGILTANGLFRFSRTSSFYVGGGLGYATVSVKIKDQYGLEKTFSSGDLGGKAFLGVGAFRMAIVWPSLGSTGGGGLLTISICSNPFR
jgi:hypothetical protein